MFDYDQLIEVTFTCCGYQGLHKLRGIIGSGLGVACPVCGEIVRRRNLELVQLTNQEVHDAVYKLRLNPLD